jgi:hypothetical protein
MALSCAPPDRQPTDAEREQWTAFLEQRQRHQAALRQALRSDPLLEPVLRQLETAGIVTLDSLRGSDGPLDDGPAAADLEDAMTNELTALLLTRSMLDSGAAPVARRLIEHWQHRGLPWTVLAAVPVDPESPEDRQRMARQLRESLDLSLNTPLASQLRALGFAISRSRRVTRNRHSRTRCEQPMSIATCVRSFGGSFSRPFWTW